MYLMFFFLSCYSVCSYFFMLLFTSLCSTDLNSTSIDGTSLNYRYIFIHIRFQLWFFFLLRFFWFYWLLRTILQCSLSVVCLLCFLNRQCVFFSFIAKYIETDLICWTEKSINATFRIKLKPIIYIFISIYSICTWTKNASACYIVFFFCVCSLFFCFSYNNDQTWH